MDSGSGVIDLTGAGLAPRVRFPSPADGFRVTGSEATPGSERPLGQTLRSRVSNETLSRMRSAPGTATRATLSQPITRENILSRYRGSASARSARIDSPEARIALDRGTGLSNARRDAARTTDARKAKQELDAQRAKDARAAKQAKDAERTQKARQNYIDSVNSSDGGEGDDGYDDGYDDGHDDGHHHDHHWDLCWDYHGHWWNYGHWGWNWGAPTWAWTFWWHHYWYNGGYWMERQSPSYYWYGPFYPTHSTVIVQVGDTSDEEVVYVYDEEPEVVYVDEAPAGEAVPLAPAAAPESGLNRAAEYYLNLGDRAFRDGRFGDSVHFYAKAVEYSPSDGILHLILSDALLGTGDYHYAAYALRKALELDPALAAAVVDKRAFYSDPAEFDRQVAVLERYLQDHFLDDDARLVLAANYLFGGRPDAAIDLLESAFSQEVKLSPTGALILETARSM